MTDHLFHPLQVRSVTFKNRIVVSPMCEYSSRDGFANDWHFVHLGSRAVGGAALVLTEAAAVTPEGRISPADLGIWDDEHITGLQRIFDFIKQQGCIAGMQLAHAGRKASTNEPWNGGAPISPDHGGWSPIYGPSALAFDAGHQVPVELSPAQIRTVVTAFADATSRARSAGAEVIEIHAAHGYLLLLFSPRLAIRERMNMEALYATGLVCCWMWWRRFARYGLKICRCLLEFLPPIGYRVGGTSRSRLAWQRC